MFSADADEVEEVLKECDGFVFAFTIGEEDREVGGEVGGFYHEVLERFTGSDCLFGQVDHRC